MSDRGSGLVLGQFHTLFSRGTLVGISEGLLLDRFVSNRDEAAFEAIVSRHGPMVLGVCRRLLDDPGDVEDAFQATFLVLVRRAGSVRHPELLANWLYGVAHRVAVRARANIYRRRLREQPGSEEVAMPSEPREDPELWAVLDEELSRLPDRLRAVIVLCDLEGAPQDVAARQFGCPLGTIKSRLSRARERLRGRLLRRGVTLSCLPVGSWLARETARAAVPSHLMAATIRAALDLAAGAVISGRTALLVEAVARSLSMTNIRVEATGVLASIVVATGALAIVTSMARDEPRPSFAAPEVLPTPALVRNALKTWWDDIETMEFREVESTIGSDGRPVQSGRRAIVEFALGRGNRRAVSHGSLEPDGRLRVTQEKRDDGRTQIHLITSAKTSDRISDVSITRQTNTRDAYYDQDGMGTVLWLLTPWTSGLGSAAQPLYQHLENPNTSTSFTVGRDGNGKASVTLRLAYEGQRYELDPDHDYLPRRVTGSLHDVTVTRFAKVNGRWFPVEGLVTRHARGSIGIKQVAFDVTDLRINRAIPDTRFEMPPDLGKARLTDFTRGTQGSRPVDH